jgi:hypothetical protein
LALLGGPTEQQLLEQRAAEYAAAEATRRALLAQAEVALWEKVQMAAAEAASEARVAFRWVYLWLFSSLRYCCGMHFFSNKQIF